MVESYFRLNKIEKNNFPKLMIIKKGYDNEGAIVLFIEENKGTILYCCNDNKMVRFKIGEYYESFDMDYFEDYNGLLSLTNSV